ncbi:GerMN domain-containing protein [Natranaerofaba carboxydovora]|uniref:GerMN domain-containing protein n=1 Tax=Natranaerofaba carboxydovora TaxID=2742683 RepID=UPI001F13D5B5|nr:GerMN domain-containing protein [Natranaerofaba carboxydovora]UMZ75452.1 Sporulation and spore germination [Natranaerofaba carboxydovora]
MKNFGKLKSPKSFWLIVLILGITMMVVAGCGNDTNNENENENEEETAANGGENGIYQEDEIKIYFTEDTGTSFVKGYETREVERVTPEEAMEMFLDGPEDEDLYGIPEDVKLLGIEVEDEIAYVDFSSELLDIVLGHESEMVLVDTIVSTLTDFDGIEKVQILVEGETAESISGHVEINEPLERW